MTHGEAVNWIINMSADIGKAEHRALWHYEQTLGEIKEMLEGEPERKGKWIQDDIASNIFRCSECGGDAPVDSTAGCEIKSKFCQWCGAKMEEEG